MSPLRLPPNRQDSQRHRRGHALHSQSADNALLINFREDRVMITKSAASGLAVFCSTFVFNRQPTGVAEGRDQHCRGLLHSSWREELKRAAKDIVQ